MNGVVETHELTMRFGGVTAVDRVNFSLQDRELRCLIGPNGAGKSTFFKCLTGQYALRSENGRVIIRGTDVTGWNTHDIVRLGVGIKTQVPSVMNGLTVQENLWLSAQPCTRRADRSASNCNWPINCDNWSANCPTASDRWSRSASC